MAHSSETILSVISKMNCHETKPYWHFFLIPFIFQIPLSLYDEVINFHVIKSIILRKVFSNMFFYNQNRAGYMLTYIFSTEPLWDVILFLKIIYVIIIWHCDFIKILPKAASAKKAQSFNYIPIMVSQLLSSFYTINYSVTLRYAFALCHVFIPLE